VHKKSPEREARAEAAEIFRINPKFSVDEFAKIVFTYKDQSQTDKVIDAMRKAGLKWESQQHPTLFYLAYFHQ